MLTLLHFQLLLVELIEVRIVDVGFEYPSDKTLSPEAFVSPTVRIDDVDVIKEINVIDGGKEYLSAPDLIVYDPEKNEIVDESSPLLLHLTKRFLKLKLLHLFKV